MSEGIYKHFLPSFFYNHTACTLQIRYDMDGSVERVNTFAVQMKMIFVANMQHCKYTYLPIILSIYGYLFLLCRQYPRMAMCCRPVCDQCCKPDEGRQRHIESFKVGNDATE